MSPSPRSDAWAPFAAGPLQRLQNARLSVDVATQAGGRIAQIRFDEVAQLIGPDDVAPSVINWGCYPMLPWAGRIRDGRFAFEGRHWQLPLNLAPHAIHGIAFALPWQIESATQQAMQLSLVLPRDEFWPFGGHARQTLRLDDGALQLELSVQAGDRPMPAELGWHPWFRKPEELVFAPTRMYPRDADGVAQWPLRSPTPGPWDDCFVHRGEIGLRRGAQRVQLESDCDHWVVYDAPAHATCVEPQTGPPDAFNLAPRILAPHATLTARFCIRWHDAAA